MEWDCEVASSPDHFWSVIWSTRSWMLFQNYFKKISLKASPLCRHKVHRAQGEQFYCCWHMEMWANFDHFDLGFHHDVISRQKSPSVRGGGYFLFLFRNSTTWSCLKGEKCVLCRHTSERLIVRFLSLIHARCPGDVKISNRLKHQKSFQSYDFAKNSGNQYC